MVNRPATFSPASGLVATDRRTPQWDAQFREAAAISYQEILRLRGTSYGVSWIDSFVATDDPEIPPNADEAGLLPEQFANRAERLDATEHPLPTRYALRTRSLRIDPAVYLERLVRDVRAAEARIVTRRFRALDELLTVPEPLVVNCTGLGSRELFGDGELTPIRGQMTILKPQPEIAYRASLRGSVSVGMTPRTDGIVLGISNERGSWSLEPDVESSRNLVAAAAGFFGAMRYT